MCVCAVPFSSRYHLIQNGFSGRRSGRLRAPKLKCHKSSAIKLLLLLYYYEEIELTGVRHLAKVKHLAECGGEEGEGFDCTPEIGEEGDDTFMLNLRNNDAHFNIEI